MEVFTEQSALLIVDMINDFVHPEGALVVPDAAQIVDYIISLIEEAQGKGIPVIHVTDSHEPDDTEFENWPPHAITGTWGSRVIDELDARGKTHMVLKTRFSGFFETELDELLSDLRVEHVVITGTVTNVCVYATALDAAMRGYHVTVPEKGVAGLSDENHKFALKQIVDVVGGEVV